MFHIFECLSSKIYVFQTFCTVFLGSCWFSDDCWNLWRFLWIWYDLIYSKTGCKSILGSLPHLLTFVIPFFPRPLEKRCRFTSKDGKKWGTIMETWTLKENDGKMMEHWWINTMNECRKWWDAQHQETHGECDSSKNSTSITSIALVGRVSQCENVSFLPADPILNGLDRHTLGFCGVFRAR